MELKKAENKSNNERIKAKRRIEEIKSGVNGIFNQTNQDYIYTHTVNHINCLKINNLITGDVDSLIKEMDFDPAYKLVEEVKEFMDQFIIKLESEEYTDDDVCNCIHAISRVLREWGESAVLYSSNRGVLVAQTKLFGDLEILFYKILSPDFEWDKIGDKLSELKRTDINDLDRDQLDDNIDRLYELGCTKIQAQKLEEVMGSKYKTFDYILGRKQKSKHDILL